MIVVMKLMTRRRTSGAGTWRSAQLAGRMEDRHRLGQPEVRSSLAVLRPIGCVVAAVHALGVDRCLTADDDDPATAAVGVQVQADLGMALDVPDLGGATMFLSSGIAVCYGTNKAPDVLNSITSILQAYKGKPSV